MSAAQVEVHPVDVFKIPGLHVSRHTPPVSAAVPFVSVAVQPVTVHVPVVYVGEVPTSSDRAGHASHARVVVFSTVPFAQHTVLCVDAAVHFLALVSNVDPVGQLGLELSLIGVQASVYRLYPAPGVGINSVL